MPAARARSLQTLVLCAVCFVAGLAGAYVLRRAGPSRQPGSLDSGAERARPDYARAEESFQEGYRLLLKERYSDALKAFRKAADLDPTDPRPQHGMAKVYQSMQFVDRAEESLRRAIAIDPGFAESYRDLVKLLHDRGEYPEAIELLEKLRALAPEDSFVTAELAINALALGRSDEAVSLLEKYNAAVGPQAWGYTQLGRAREAAGRSDEAAEAYRRALAIDPRFTLAYHRLGLLLAARGEEKESARYLERYRELRKLETRAHQLEMLLLRDPDQVDVLMQLAQARFALGKAREALLLIDRALAQRPDDASIQAIRRKVAAAVGGG